MTVLRAIICTLLIVLLYRVLAGCGPAPVANDTPHGTADSTPAATSSPEITPEASSTPDNTPAATPEPDITPEVAPALTPDAPRCWGVVRDGPLNVRQAPSISAPRLGTLEAGAYVTIESVAQADDGVYWYQIWWLPEIQGYVHSDYIDVAGPPADCSAVFPVDLWEQKKG